jgi:hypothetical protein
VPAHWYKRPPFTGRLHFATLAAASPEAEGVRVVDRVQNFGQPLLWDPAVELAQRRTKTRTKTPTTFVTVVCIIR